MKKLFVLLFLVLFSSLGYANTEEDIKWVKYFIKDALTIEKNQNFELDENPEYMPPFVEKEWRLRIEDNRYAKRLYKVKSFDEVYKQERQYYFCEGFSSGLPESLPKKNTFEEQMIVYYYQDMLAIKVCDVYYLFKKTKNGFIESIISYLIS